MAINYVIDNNGFNMKDAINNCIDPETLETIKIATGYWDLHGVALIVDKLSAFLQKDDVKLQLLIGTDPFYYETELKKDIYKDRYKNCNIKPDDYIRVDLNDDIPANATRKATKSIKIHDLNDAMDNECQQFNGNKKAIELLLNYQDKIEVRKYDKNKYSFLHSKCYIFEGHRIENGPTRELKRYAYGIIGSSNFTGPGLTSNAELNHVECSEDVVMRKEGSLGHNKWFETLWEKADKWDEFFEIISQSNAKKNIDSYKSCEEVYVKFLQNEYHAIIDEQTDNIYEGYLPANRRKKLKYQIDAAKHCIDKLKKYNGFLLADVVGLGKTTVGALVIRKFLDMSDDERGGRKKNILIIVPPTLQKRWEDELILYRYGEKTLRDCCKFITIGSIQKANAYSDISNLDDIENVPEDSDTSTDTGKFEVDDNYNSLKQTDYGLILIDESHKFRNEKTRMYRDLNGMHQEREWKLTQNGLIQDIYNTTGHYPWIGLLSATPQNNSPKDIRNQIYLFEQNPCRSRIQAPDGYHRDLHGFFKDLINQYNNKLKEYTQTSEKSQTQKASYTTKNAQTERISLELRKLSKKLRDLLRNSIMVRRTRRDIDKQYHDDMASNGWKFPEVQEPELKPYPMDDKTLILFKDSMDALCADFDNEDGQNKYNPQKQLGFYQYRAAEFIKNVDQNPQKSLFDSPNELELRTDENARQYSVQLARMMQVQHAKCSTALFMHSVKLFMVCSLAHKTASRCSTIMLFIIAQILTFTK